MIYSVTTAVLAAVATVLLLILIFSGKEEKKWIIADAFMVIASWLLTAVCWVIESG